MYTADFTDSGWAVFHWIGKYGFRISDAVPGDKGREWAKAEADKLNQKTDHNGCPVNS